jgi:hypothetical protein
MGSWRLFGRMPTIAGSRSGGRVVKFAFSQLTREFAFAFSSSRLRDELQKPHHLRTR